MPRQEIPEEVLGPDGFLAGRFISPSARYSVAVHGGSERLITDARGNSFLHKETDPILCQFEQSGLRDHEIETAFERFNFSGLAEGINPVTRIGIFDPEAYAIARDLSDEERKTVERKLWFESEAHPDQLVFVGSPRAARPWPSYDNDTVEFILDVQERLAIDPEKVRLYEEENQQRQEIIAVMWTKESGGDRGGVEESVAATVSA